MNKTATTKQRVTYYSHFNDWVVQNHRATQWGRCYLFAKSWPTLCNPTDCSPPYSFVHGISQARIPEWVAISFSRGSSQPRDRTWVSWIASRFFYCLSHQGCSSLACAHAQLRLSLCNLRNCSLPGSSVHGISQARIPEWVAISFSRGASRARDQT